MGMVQAADGEPLALMLVPGHQPLPIVTDDLHERSLRCHKEWDGDDEAWEDTDPPVLAALRAKAGCLALLPQSYSLRACGALAVTFCVQSVCLEILSRMLSCSCMCHRNNV